MKLIGKPRVTNFCLLRLLFELLGHRLNGSLVSLVSFHSFPLEFGNKPLLLRLEALRQLLSFEIQGLRELLTLGLNRLLQTRPLLARRLNDALLFFFESLGQLKLLRLEAPIELLLLLVGNLNQALPLIRKCKLTLFVLLRQFPPLSRFALLNRHLVLLDQLLNLFTIFLLEALDLLLTPLRELIRHFLELLFTTLDVVGTQGLDALDLH